VAEAEAKQRMKVTTEEKSRLRKEKQAKNQAKVAERERRQNQENICKSLFTSIVQSLNTRVALDTRQYGEDDFHQLVPQDATVIFTLFQFYYCRLVLFAHSSVCVTYLQESKPHRSIFPCAQARSLLHAPSRPTLLRDLLHVVATMRQMYDLFVSLVVMLIFCSVQTPARALTAERASDMVRLRTQTPLVMSQARQPTGKHISLSYLNFIHMLARSSTNVIACPVHLRRARCGRHSAIRGCFRPTRLP
jgi:hypothetical protein